MNIKYNNIERGIRTSDVYRSCDNKIRDKTCDIEKRRKNC